jgi:osmotically-inducible protein OsmY
MVKLTVKAKEGAVVVSGTVQTSDDQLNKIEPLAKQIKGVKSVNVAAKVAVP